MRRGALVRHGGGASRVELLRAALEALGGEASVHQLWVKTRLRAIDIDHCLMNQDWAERASLVHRGNGGADGLGDRRWRLRSAS